jgi:glycolate oxidase iron-sulfur subunit
MQTGPPERLPPDPSPTDAPPLDALPSGPLPSGPFPSDPPPPGPQARLRELAGDCVHCGFCLPACPTYQLWGEEMDSPRGRIHLMTQLLDGAPSSAAAILHLDRCLGCLACVPACPSGVRYDLLIESARSWTERGAAEAGPQIALPPRSLRQRLARAAIFATFPYPRRLRLLTAPLRLAQLTRLDRVLSGRAAGMLVPELAAALRVAPRHVRRNRELAGALGEPGTHGSRGGRLPERIPAHGPRRAVVGLLTGCVQRAYFPAVNTATGAVLAAEGCDVIVPAGQGCCGALGLHGGRTAQAVTFARSTIECFERAGVDVVVVNAAGCGSAMKGYGELLAGDAAWAGRAAAMAAKVRDFTEFLAELGTVAARHPLAVTTAYQDPCHLAHAQGITAQPRQLLRGIPGLTVAEIGDSGTCCGSAGIYSLVQPGPAAELGSRKAAAVLRTGAQAVISANPGCALQVAAALQSHGAALPVLHIAEVLDASIRAVPVSTLLA